MDKLTYEKNELRKSRDKLLEKYNELHDDLIKYLYLKENINKQLSNEDIIDMFFTYNDEDETKTLERLITCIMYFDEPTNLIATKKIKEDMKIQKKKSRQRK